MASDPGDPRARILERLCRGRLLAALHGGLKDPATAAHAAVEAGFPALEVSVRLPGWRELLDELPGPERLLIGLGGILDDADLKQAAEADVDFLATPVLQPELVDVARRKQVPCLLGALSPSEAHSAAEAGADLVRLGPLEMVGGAAFVRELRGPLPDLPLAATGALSPEAARECANAGARLVCVELDEQESEPALVHLRRYIELL